MAYRFFTTDVFTNKRFGGNQLAVFPDAKGLTKAQMQSIAREFHFSETTFVLPPKNEKHTAHVRIFTPASELPFAGHPTIGTAFVLASDGMIDLMDGENEIVFEEGVGAVPVTITVNEGKPVFMRFSVTTETEFGPDAPSHDAIAAALSLKAREIGAGDAKAMAVSYGLPYLFVPLRNRSVVGRAAVNPAAWSQHMTPYEWAKGVYVFSFDPSERGAHIHARMFAPAEGVPEDPATGSAATGLAAYLTRLEGATEGTMRWIVEQGVKMGRPSLIEVECDIEAGNVTSVRIGGNAVLMSQGDFYI